MRDNIVEMGLQEESLYAAMKKFETIGGRTEAGRRNPSVSVLGRLASPLAVHPKELLRDL